jgi:hypothetical protein
MNNIDFSKVVSATQMAGDTENDTELLKEMLREAEAYLSAFDWCETIRESYFGLGVGSIVAVFLFRIIPRSEGVDEWLWVVVGDLPPAYLVTDDNPTPVSALEAYIEEMNAWVVAVNDGRSVGQQIPLDVSPTRENSEQLKRRLTFLTTKVIPNYNKQSDLGRIQ